MTAWNTARNILCVRLDSLGDVLMTTPAIRAVRESAPGRRITLLTSSSGAAVAPLISEVDDVICYDAPWNKMSAPPEGSRADRKMIRRIAAEEFDAAIIFTVFSQNPLPAAMLCYLAEIPLRLAHCRENPYYLLTDWVPDPDPGDGIRHEVQRQLDLVASVGCATRDHRLSLTVPQHDHDRVSGLLKERGIDETQTWAVVHAGATAPSRRYPPEHFAVVARTLVQEHGIPVVFSGTGVEAQLVKWIQAQMRAPSISLVNQLTLSELAALIALAPIAISNNSGPAHVAAAMGTPVIDLYALTNPQHTPWNVPHRVLFHDVACKYCYKSVCPEGHHNCMRKLQPERVVEAALSLLKETEKAHG